MRYSGWRIVCWVFGITCLTLASGCCSNDEGDTATESPGAAKTTQPGSGPKIGDSCEGLKATEGRMACQGTLQLFCSSFSNYKWKRSGECTGGTKCVLGADGRSTSCE